MSLQGPLAVLFLTIQPPPPLPHPSFGGFHSQHSASMQILPWPMLVHNKSEAATGLGSGKQEKRSLLAASVPQMAASVIRAVQRVLEHARIPVSRALVLELYKS